MRRACGVCVLSSLALSASVLAQDEASTAGPRWVEDERWTVRIEPAAWYVGLRGDVQLPRASGEPGNFATDLSAFDLDDSSMLQPLGEITLRRGDWGIALRGFVYSQDSQARGRAGRVGDLVIADGDRIVSSVEMVNFEIEGMYTLVKGARSALSARDGYKVRWRVDALAGVRVLDTQWAITSPDLVATDTSLLSAGAEETAFHPLVGMKVSATFVEQFTVDVKVDVGWLGLGDTSSYGVDILVGGTWQPHRNFGVQVGYRALAFGVSSGDGAGEYEFTGSAQGLYAGVVLEF